MVVDFGKTARDYDTHRKSFPDSFFDRARKCGVGCPKQTILDLGTGTGLLALEFARKGCDVVGLDPSKALLAKASERAVAENLNVSLVHGRAENLGFDDSSFDVVCAATAWHWFDGNSAFLQSNRVLRPNGRLCIAALGWHLAQGSVGQITLDLIRKHIERPQQIKFSNVQYPLWAEDGVRCGFRSFEMFAYSETIEYSLEAWCGRVRASQAIGAVLPEEEATKFSDILSEELYSKFRTLNLPVEHRIECLVLVK